MADRFEQWSRARLGEYVQRDGETFAVIEVPVDSREHDPRADVIAALLETSLAAGLVHSGVPTIAAVPGDQAGELLSGVAIAAVANMGVEHADVNRPRHRKTRGK